jgi:hypothetical protein
MVQSLYVHRSSFQPCFLFEGSMVLAGEVNALDDHDWQNGVVAAIAQSREP